MAAMPPGNTARGSGSLAATAATSAHPRFRPIARVC